MFIQAFSADYSFTNLISAFVASFWYWAEIELLDPMLKELKFQKLKLHAQVTGPTLLMKEIDDAQEC